MQQVLPEVLLPAHTAALFACSSQEASYEHAKLRHGVFSNYVLSGLEGSADVPAVVPVVVGIDQDNLATAPRRIG